MPILTPPRHLTSRRKTSERSTSWPNADFAINERTTPPTSSVSWLYAATAPARRSPSGARRLSGCPVNRAPGCANCSNTWRPHWAGNDPHSVQYIYTLPRSSQDMTQSGLSDRSPGVRRWMPVPVSVCTGAAHGRTSRPSSLASGRSSGRARSGSCSIPSHSSYSKFQLAAARSGGSVTGATFPAARHPLLSIL